LSKQEYLLVCLVISISLWILVVRNLSGHKGAIRSVELFSVGEFAASTSADCNVKVS